MDGDVCTAMLPLKMQRIAIIAEKIADIYTRLNTACSHAVWGKLEGSCLWSEFSQVHQGDTRSASKFSEQMVPQTLSHSSCIISCAPCSLLQITVLLQCRVLAEPRGKCFRAPLSEQTSLFLPLCLVFSFSSAHLVSLAQPLNKNHGNFEDSPTHSSYSLPRWLHAEGVGGEKLRSGVKPEGKIVSPPPTF